MMTIKNIRYRKAEISDIDLLVDYRIEFLKELQTCPSNEAEMELRNELKNYFSATLKNKSYFALIAEINGQPIGFGGMVYQKVPGHFNWVSGESAYILNMYTVPQYRKRGIANQILDQLMQEGKNKGIKKFVLHASEDGVGIYRKKGFSEPHLPVLELSNNEDNKW